MTSHSVVPAILLSAALTLTIVGCNRGVVSEKSFRHRRTMTSNGDRSYSVLDDGTVWRVKRKPQRQLDIHQLPGIANAWYVQEGAQAYALTREGRAFSLDEAKSQKIDTPEFYIGFFARRSILMLTAKGLAEEPVQIKTGISAVKGEIIDMAEGDECALALLSDGTVWAAGKSGRGEAGVHKDEVPEPVQVKGLPRIVQISAASYASYALDENGGWWTWGVQHPFVDGWRTVPEKDDAPPNIVWIDDNYAVDAQGGLFLRRLIISNQGEKLATQKVASPCSTAMADEWEEGRPGLILCRDGKLMISFRQVHSEDYVEVKGLGRVAVPRLAR